MTLLILCLLSNSSNVFQFNRNFDMIIYLILAISLIVTFASVVILFRTVSGRKAENEAIRDSVMMELQQNIDRLQNNLEMQIKLTAGDSLGGATRSLKEANMEQINAILSPLKEKIDNFNRSLTIANTQAASSRKSLDDHVERLMRLNMTISNDARSLAEALKGNNKVQGEWGETVLTGLLENAGLKEGIHFFTQLTKDESGHALTSENGRTQRPDVVVILPGGNRIVIDSKVSLKSYLEMCDAEDLNEKEEARRRHLAAIRRHIDKLSEKKYHKTVADSADYVIMFVPNEGAFISAIEADRNLSVYAMEKNIIIASSCHLLSMLSLTARVWRKEDQDRNAAEIARLGGLLYDKVASFCNDMANIEKYINMASGAYRNAFGKLVEGRQSVVARAERLRQMGVKCTSRIPASMTSEMTESEPVISEEVSEP